MADVADFDRLVGREHGLSVVSTLRADQTIQATVVNCGVLDHPVRCIPVIGFTTRGNSRKLANLRARPRLAATVRAGWEWVTAEGAAELAGPQTHSTVSARTACGCCCARCSARQAAVTRTGTPMTG